MLLREGHRHAASVPPTVQAVVAARLDALPAPARDVARRSSVFLSSFDRDQVAALASAESAIDIASRSSRKLLVRVDDGVPRWRFRHQTLRDVAYASLPKRQRRELHLAVADRLTADGHRSWAAEHLEQAALAALDLEPRRGNCPTGPPTPWPRPGTARAGAWRTGRRSLGTGARSPWPATAIDGGARGAGARGHGGPSTGRRVPGRPRSSSRPSNRYAPRRRLDARARPPVPRRHLDQRGRRRRQRGVTARSFPRTAERLGEPAAIARTLLFAGWVPWTRKRLEDAEAIWRRSARDRRVMTFAGRMTVPLCSLDRDRRPEPARRSDRDDRARPRGGDRHGRSIQSRGCHGAGRRRRRMQVVPSSAASDRRGRGTMGASATPSRNAASPSASWSTRRRRAETSAGRSRSARSSANASSPAGPGVRSPTCRSAGATTRSRSNIADAPLWRSPPPALSAALREGTYPTVRLIGTAASAIETGQFCLAPSAASRKPSASRPGTSPTTCSRTP